MQQSCPISFEKYDNTLSRIASFFVTVLLAVYLQTGWILFVFFIFFDLFVRVFVDKRLSLLFHLSKIVETTLALKPVMKDNASKKLASYFGLFFAISIIVFHFLEIRFAVLVFATIYVVCLLLDSFFDFCLGCKIYYIIKKVYPDFMS